MNIHVIRDFSFSFGAGRAGRAAALVAAIAMSCAAAACRPGKSSRADPAELQTDAGEAALRYMIEHCPRRAEAKLAVIGLGENLSAPAPEFVDRFRDVAGLTFIAHSRVVAGMVGGKSRRFEEASGEPVLELQIGSLSEAKDGAQEAVAAWAFKDEADRKRLRLTAKGTGGFEVRELETIPVPHRNDDTSRGASY